jgi:polygalacturonase
MNVLVKMHTARSAVLEIVDGGRYFSKETYDIKLNSQWYGTTEQTIVSLFGLTPETEYKVELYKHNIDTDRQTTDRQTTDRQIKVGETVFTTDYEFVTLNVKAFGAKGDGVQDDTHFIQTAIMACPRDSRVLIPAGIYRITNLFLKSHLRLELAKDAELRGDTDRAHFPILPGLIQSYDETDEYNLGTWEGNPLPMFAGIICGIQVEDVILYGEGVINGNASKQDWWENPKVMRGAYRPRLFFLSHSKQVTLQGIKFCNSPSWTLHPYFSQDLHFLGITVNNPSDSPNTDGLDPESCENVEVLGVRFSLGDDCIAVKSGKIYMGKKHKTPSSHIQIRQCLMENGHGAVTLGSEMSGGVNHLTVEDCVFRHTDRGLRIKTRRGRGKDAVLDQITFRNLTLDHVMTPLVVNAFYFCDPDGRTPYVQSRDVYPVDEKTPVIKSLTFENMTCTNVHVAAAYFDGLPEKKIQEISLKNVSFSYADQPKCDVPAMSEGVEPCSKMGIFARNITCLQMENVYIQGQNGETLITEGVDEVQE